MIPLLVPQVRSSLEMGFQPTSGINNHFNIFIHSSYVIHIICTMGIAATIEMEVWCAWVEGKTCVIRKMVGKRIDPCYYMVKYSHTRLEQVKRGFSHNHRNITRDPHSQRYPTPSTQWPVKDSTLYYLITETPNKIPTVRYACPNTEVPNNTASLDQYQAQFHHTVNQKPYNHASYSSIFWFHGCPLQLQGPLQDNQKPTHQVLSRPA